MKLSLLLKLTLLFGPILLSADVGQVATQLKITDGLNGLASGSLDTGDGFAFATAILGDLDHNGVNDIAVGVPGDAASGGNNNAGSENGAVWILTLDTDGSVLTQLKIADGLNGLATGSLDEGDTFGYSIANIGDLDHNGVDDIAVGAPGDDASGGDNNNGSGNGAVWILTLDTDGSVLTQLKIADGLNGLTSGSLDDDGFGFSIANIGDLDHNGVDDIAVGALGDASSEGDNNAGDNNGAVWILTLDTDGSVLTQLKIADGLNGLASGSLNDEDQFGKSIANLGDLDHNGVNDIAVGANGGANGAVWILTLDADGSVLTQLKIADGLNGLPSGSLNVGDNFGTSIANLGDLDHNGINDIAVGAIGDDTIGGVLDSGGYLVGAVWILTLDTDGSVLTQFKIADGLNGLASGSLNNFNTFGASITAIDDLDGNGIKDIAVGAGFDSFKGAVWILSLGEAPVVPDPTLSVSNFPGSISLGGVISATLSTTNFAGTVSYSTSGTLPQGLALSGSDLGGVITEPGSFSFTVTATDGTDTDNKILSLAVTEETSIHEILEQTHYANTESYQRWELDPNKSLSQPFAVSVVGGLPRGLKLTDTTVEGVFAETGTFTFTLLVSSGSDRIEHRFNVTVMEPTLAPLITAIEVNGQYFPMNITAAPTHTTPAVSDLFNTTAQVNMALEMTFLWDFIKDPFSFVIVEGELPQGLSLDGTSGVISGAPTETGEFIFVVSVKDWRSRAFQWVRLVVE